jgi:hypothetical protein
MKLAAACLTLATALAQSGIEEPRGGYYRDPEGALRPLYGLAGSYVPGRAALKGVLGSASSEAGVLIKLADTVEWLDQDLRLIARWPAPAGPAQFTFSGKSTAQAWFPATGQTMRYELVGAPQSVVATRRRPLADRGPAPLERIRRAVEESGLADEVSREAPIEPIGERVWSVAGRLAVRLDGATAAVYRIPQAAAGSPLELMTMPDRTVRAPGAAVDLGSAAVFARRTYLFRVTNTSVAPIRLDRIDVNGVGFVILDPPGLPATLVSRGYVEFRVEFWPQMAGTFSAALTVNSDSYLLVTEAAGGAAGAITLEWNGQALEDGATVYFSGAASQQFVLANHGDGPATVQQITVTGAGFHGPLGATAPLTVGAHQETPFQVTLTPAAAPCCQGTLTVDGVRVTLKAAVLPSFQIAVDQAALRSRQQANVSLRFTGAAPMAAQGRLQMDFIGKGDPSVCFLSGDPRSIPFTVRAGEDRARFGEAAAVGFQTGTTAGTLRFTATLGAETEELTIQIGPEPVGVESVRLTAGPNSVSVALTGFDNTRSASMATFTFYDAQNRVLGGGSLSTDAGAAFSQFFANAQMGGAFVLRAVFPVTGAVASIDSAEVTLLNSAGSAQGHGKIAE